MTIDELHHAADSAKWFKNMGTFSGGEGMLSLRNLEAWGGDDDAETNAIAEAMTWMPSTYDGNDPFHDWEPFKKEPGAADCIDAAKLAYKLTLLSLRNMEKNDLFFVGSHNFTGLAKDAATFAFYSAALEIKFIRPGPWIQIVRLYQAGHWPCATMPDKRIVVI